MLEMKGYERTEIIYDTKYVDQFSTGEPLGVEAGHRSNTTRIKGTNLIKLIHLGK